MELDVELIVSLTSPLAQDVRDVVGAEFELVGLSVPGKFSLRSKLEINSDLLIDEGVQSYLNAIKPLEGLLFKTGGLLCIGAFFSDGEAAAFSVQLSGSTIKVLAQYNLEIEVTCYPCA